MPGNTFGYLFRLTTYGESHGPAVGGVIDGCPAGISIDYDFIQQELDRRKPVYPGSTLRKEPDTVEFLSGIKDKKTLGTPIGFLIKNRNVRTRDYKDIEDLYRPSHADYSYDVKYRTPVSGGGRASGRETVARVVAGSIAKLFLRPSQIDITAFISQLGNVVADPDPTNISLPGGLRSHLGFFDEKMEQRALAHLAEVRQIGDTRGGTIICLVKGAPPGLGEPVFSKLQADLAGAMLSIGSCKAFEYGLGFSSASWKGSEYNDQMTINDGRIRFLTNHDGGIQGGISNGEDIIFRVGFKPPPSVRMPQQTVSRKGEPATIVIGGRHDTSHIPRLVVIVESMAAIVLADHMLRNSASLMP